MHPCAFVALFTANNFHSITKKEEEKGKDLIITSFWAAGCNKEKERDVRGATPFPRLRLEGLFFARNKRAPLY